MLDLLRRDGDTSNTLIGIILLVMLLVFVGPNILPGLLARTFPFVDEGVPCSRLRNADDRAFHQSLIGRASQNPLSIQVRPGSVPLDNNGELVIRTIITNNTIGTVPIVFDEEQVIVGDNGSSGVGLIFTPANALTTGRVRQTGAVTSFPESTIKLLGPRQRCVHTEYFPASQLDTAIRSGTATVQAYYRITGAGQSISNNPGTAPVYPDQGLDIIDNGFLISDPAVIPLFIAGTEDAGV